MARLQAEISSQREDQDRHQRTAAELERTSEELNRTESKLVASRKEVSMLRRQLAGANTRCEATGSELSQLKQQLEAITEEKQKLCTLSDELLAAERASKEQAEVRAQELHWQLTESNKAVDQLQLELQEHRCPHDLDY